MVLIQGRRHTEVGRARSNLNLAKHTEAKFAEKFEVSPKPIFDWEIICKMLTYLPVHLSRCPSSIPSQFHRFWNFWWIWTSVTGLAKNFENGEIDSVWIKDTSRDVPVKKLASCKWFLSQNWSSRNFKLQTSSFVQCVSRGWELNACDQLQCVSTQR